MTRERARTLRLFLTTFVAASPWRVAGDMLLLLAASLMEGVGVLLLVPLLTLVGFDAGGGALGRVTTGFSHAFSIVGVRPTLPIVLIVYVGATALQTLFQRWQTMLDVAARFDFVWRLRKNVYDAIARAQWAFVARVRSSEAIHVLTQEIDRVRQASVHLTSLAVASILALVYVAIALRVAPVITAVVVVCGSLLALRVRGALGRTGTVGRAWSVWGGRVLSALTEHLAGMKTAKSFGAADRHAEIFDRLSREERKVHLKAMRTHTALRQHLALGVAVMLAGVVYVSYAVLRLPPAQVLLLLLMFARLVPRLTAVYESAQGFAVTFPAYEAVVAFEARCLAAREPVVAVQEPIALRHSIHFDDVTFDYRRDGTAVAVQALTFEIAAGQTTAIVGPSGAGKSTVADLLTGLLEPTGGRILVDGRPLTAACLDAWRDHIGYVLQDTFLFHESVRANLVWARPGAADDDLWRALQSAAAADFVAALPEGLDTVVGDRGMLVSGGERQRLALARALLRRPALLILDEATSSIDSENEARIQAAIDRLHEQITIVIITHRLSTVRHADIVHVIDRGRLVESGSWTALAAREHGRFRELCRAQGLEEPILAQHR